MLLPKLKEKNIELSDLIADLKQPAETTEVRFKISGEDYKLLGESVIVGMHDLVAQTPGFSIDMDNEEGIRTNVSQGYGDGWFLLRMSLHEPLLVLQVENDMIGKNTDVLSKLLPFFNRYEFLNTEPLKKLLEGN